jgi:hypothetical protein
MTILGYIDYALNFAVYACIYGGLAAVPAVATVRYVRRRRTA